MRIADVTKTIYVKAHTGSSTIATYKHERNSFANKHQYRRKLSALHTLPSNFRGLLSSSVSISAVVGSVDGK
jgi:hypothetical protein